MRRTQLTLVAALLANTPEVSATDWYVDVDAPSAPHTGVDWDHAWVSFQDIIWASIGAGDTIWVAGGTYNDGVITWGTSGTQASPIRLKCATNSPYNDHVTINGRLYFGGTGSWVTIDGSKIDSSTNHFTNVFNLKTMLTNSINLKIDSSSLSQYPVNVGSASGLSFKWVEITGQTNYGTGDHLVNFNGLGTNTTIHYCWLHHGSEDGIHISTSADWDSLDLGWCLVERIAEDGVEGDSGVNIHHCYFNKCTMTGDDEDAFVLFEKVRIYNNVIVDYPNMYIYCGKQRHTNLCGFMSFYGNLIYHEDLVDPGGTEAGIFWGVASGDDETGTSVVTNLFIFNNTVICDPPNGLLDGIKLGNRFAPGLQLTVTNAAIYNNVIYNAASLGISAKGWASEGIVFGESEFPVDYNLIWSTNSNGRRIYYRNSGTPWDDAIAFNAGTSFDFNRTNSPLFVDAASFDFNLQSVDSGARNFGKDLSSYTNSLPGINVDLTGSRRGADGSWDIGAYEYTPSLAITNGLLVWLTFEDDFGAAWKITDYSTNGAHAWKQTNWAGFSTNWPKRVAASTTPGINSNGYCGEFTYWYDGWSPTVGGRSGTYGAIATNISGLTNLTEATFALWARYYGIGAIVATNPAGADNNACLISGGDATERRGSWGFGRQDTTCTRFRVITNDSGYGRAFTDFPDLTFNAASTNQGNSSNWYHYAVTFNNGLLTTYFNGVLLSNLTVSATALVVNTEQWPAMGKWIGIGCDTHSATPPLDLTDEMPNHGWFNGVMDDVRIYNRVLSATEVATLAGGEEPIASTIQKAALRGNQTWRGNVRIQ